MRTLLIVNLSYKNLNYKYLLFSDPSYWTSTQGNLNINFILPLTCNGTQNLPLNESLKSIDDSALYQYREQQKIRT
jgi:hypothetical protein